MARPRKKSSTSEARRHRALSSKKPAKKKPRIATLYASLFEGYTRWSLDYNVSEHLFREMLDKVKLRIFLEYGHSNKFITEDKSWKTDKEVVYLIQDDIEWFNDQGIEVKLNL